MAVAEKCGVPKCKRTQTVAFARNPLMNLNRIRVCQQHAKEIDEIDDKSREAYFGWGNYLAADRPRLVIWDDVTLEEIERTEDK